MGETGSVAVGLRSVPAAPSAPPAGAVVLDSANEETETLAAVASAPPIDDPGPSIWPDESSESAYLSDARARGESVAPAKAREEMADEIDAKALPSLEELVQRIPAEVREVLDDLFRAKFTTVRRIPRKALKG